MSNPEIKICGLTRPEDALLAAELGADRIGVVLVPGTPRARSADEARAIAEAARLPLTIVVAGLPADEAAALAERAGAAAIQLHGDEPPETLIRLRELGPWELWKAVRVRDGTDLLSLAEGWAGVADLLLLDGWHPTLLGGSGSSFRWDALDAVRAGWPAGLGLGVAGGLRPDTVAEAARRLRPDLLDVSSGVERDGRPGEKDARLLDAFLVAVRGAAESSGA